MSDKPAAMVAIDDLASNIRNTMARAPDVFPPSMRRQCAQMVSHWLRMKMRGDVVIYPGMAKMAKWGQCSDRQARENFRRLRLYDVVLPVAYVRGGRRSTRFRLDLMALYRALVVAGSNPSAVLLEKIRNAAGNSEVNPEINPEVCEAKKPEEKPEATSAGIHTYGDPTQEGCTVIRFERRASHA